MNRSANLGRAFRERQRDLPAVNVEIDVPPQLVEFARTLYQYYLNPPNGVSAPQQSFPEYLHDIVLERLTLELHYPHLDVEEPPDRRESCLPVF